MLQLLWQLEIHAKTTVEYISEDTQHTICVALTHHVSKLVSIFKSNQSFEICPLSSQCKSIWIHLVFWNHSLFFILNVSHQTACFVLIQTENTTSKIKQLILFKTCYFPKKFQSPKNCKFYQKFYKKHLYNTTKLPKYHRS